MQLNTPNKVVSKSGKTEHHVKISASKRQILSRTIIWITKFSGRTIITERKTRGALMSSCLTYGFIDRTLGTVMINAAHISWFNVTTRAVKSSRAVGSRCYTWNTCKTTKFYALKVPIFSTLNFGQVKQRTSTLSTCPISVGFRPPLLGFSFHIIIDVWRHT